MVSPLPDQEHPLEAHQQLWSAVTYSVIQRGRGWNCPACCTCYMPIEEHPPPPLLPPRLIGP
jgi:hypothetical protein